MNKAEFINILQTPQLLSKAQTEDVKTIIEEFPYFQLARAIHLKGLKNSESFKYNQALKTTAAYTTDRSILFDFITSKEFIQNKISQHIKQNTTQLQNITVEVEDISVNKKTQIDKTPEIQLKHAEKSLDPELFQPKIKKEQLANFELDTSEKITETKATQNHEPLTPQEVLSLGKPLEFDKTETHSFNEWLMLAKFKPIQRDIKTKQTIKTKKSGKKTLSIEKKFELIEKFIETNPKLKQQKTPAKTPKTTHNIAKKQMIKPEALMTETLARIYVEQKNYEKAIQSYNILSLKYPEKSGFFADQIKAIKQLQEQNNNE